MSEPPYHIDIEGLGDADGDGNEHPFRDRPWVGIQFTCCGVYARVYRNQAGNEYVGRCPRCTREVRLKVGPGGTSSRFFVAE